MQTTDARAIDRRAEIWITDPPYADAINYHELSEFFLAWYEKRLPALFRDWYSDSKRALAVRGADADFRRSMVDCYRNLAAHMPDDGLQVVMFTHQDASIWADLTLILWAAGLRVTAAWTVATETPFGVKEGNYVQGTVLMVLRKQTTGETAFLDEVVPEVDAEVERQLASMLALDDREDPNFSDADYQLAAYAAALRVLTQYGSIEDIDVSHELSRERRRDEPNPIEKIIGDAVRTASNYLVPEGLPAHLWRGLAPEEKLYLKGLDVERRGDFRSGVYQEFARGFGVRDYRDLLHTGKANRTRLKTASEIRAPRPRRLRVRAQPRPPCPLRRLARGRRAARSPTASPGSAPSCPATGRSASRWPRSSATSPPSTPPTGAKTPPPPASSPAPWTTTTSDRPHRPIRTHGPTTSGGAAMPRAPTPDRRT